MSEKPIQIKVVKETVAQRAARGRKSGFPWWMGVTLVGALLGMGLLLGQWGSQPDVVPAPQPEKNLPVQKQQTLDKSKNSLAEKDPQVEVIEDDGQSLWVSPTEGDPLALNYLPMGTQLVLHLRTKELLEHAEGSKVLAALGPWGEKALAQLTRLTGAKLSEIHALTLAGYLAEEGHVQWGARLELVDSWDEAHLSPRLPDSKKEKQDDQGILKFDGRACFLPNRSSGKLLISCPLDALDEILRNGADNVLFARDMQRLIDHTDSHRMVTLVFPNKFLQISGKKMIHGTAESLLAICKDLFRDDSSAVALSAHWDENFFLELQSAVNLNRRPHAFASDTRKRISKYSSVAEDAVLAQPHHTYGRKVVGRFPNMLRKLSNYTRGGEIDRITVLRSYLPLVAGHNLIMATELMLQDFAHAGHAPIDPSPEHSESIDQRLQQVTSLAFPKETLQKALEMLSEDIGIAIRIAGSDLQLDGITKNQSLSLDMRDRPAAEILVEVLLKANPDRTITGPQDPLQKLVYVIQEEADSTKVIIVTTRSATQKRGDKLPNVFQISE